MTALKITSSGSIELAGRAPIVRTTTGTVELRKA